MYVPHIVNAAYDGDLAKVQECLEGGEHIEAEDYDGRTALFHAARWGHFEVANYLIKNGANVNQGDNKGQFPIYEAAIARKPAIVELLKQNGAVFDEKQLKTASSGCAGCLGRLAGATVLVFAFAILFSVTT